MALLDSKNQQRLARQSMGGIIYGAVVFGLIGCVQAGAGGLTTAASTKNDVPTANQPAAKNASYRLIITFLHPVTANAPELLAQMSHYAAAEVTYIRAIDATMHVYQVQPKQAEPVATLIARLQSFQNVKAVDEDRVLMRQ
ncbi:hypothetical protein ACMYR3_14495 [Ampullimonas aquatilis]|uniref:hypothetical protein n=1 Tax=Ampullimonas aquatilis TaxID=1341549 RepID=UPI003C746904